MRIFFASDFHGSEAVWNKFLKAPALLGAQVLICGGDLTGKRFVPLVKGPDGSFTATVYGRVQRAETDAEASALAGRVAGGGGYVFRTTPEGLADLEGDGNARGALFTRLMCDRLHAWLDLAGAVLPDGVPLFMMAGNDDTPAIDEVFAGQERAVFADGDVLDLGEGLSLATAGYSNQTPWRSPRELSEEALSEVIAGLIDRVPDPSRLVLNVHVPPYGSGLDQAPEVDGQLRPRWGPLGTRRVPVGSTAVREAIERYQPLLGLHGHIHESPGQKRVGQTLCLNPGSEYAAGALRGFLVDVDGGRVTSVVPVAR